MTPPNLVSSFAVLAYASSLINTDHILKSTKLAYLDISDTFEISDEVLDEAFPCRESLNEDI